MFRFLTQSPSQRITQLSWVLALVTSCGSPQSKDNDQGNVYQDYTVTYYASSNTTEYRANLRRGSDTGPAMSLSEPSRILVNGHTLSNSDAYPSYTLKSAGPPQSQVEFTWVDENNRTYFNKVSQAKVEFLNPPTSISRSRKTSIAFTGMDPTDGHDLTDDRITLRVRSLINSQYIDRYAETGASVVIFDESSLVSLKAGAADMRLTLTARRPLGDATEAGGRVTIQYEAEIKKITLEN